MSSSPPTPTLRSGRVALVGRANVGKSTLLNALLGHPLAITSPHPQTTRQVVRGVLTTEAAQYVFVDTPGIHAPRTRLGRWMNELARRQALDADAVVLVSDVRREGDAEPEPRPDDLAIAAEIRAPLVLVLSKIDRLEDKAKLLPLMGAYANARSFAAIVPLSAKREGAAQAAAGPAPPSGGLARLLDELRPLLPEQPPLCDPDALSDQPERFFVAELVREQVLRHTRQEVPHGVAVVVDRFDEASRPARIEATIHVAREAHTKIVVGAGGAMLKRIGTDARARIEAMLGSRVHLALRVRATPDWMNDEARLEELGYGRSGP
ncbi:MAG TPA: GTPase Era [Polyangiaceae bacterium]|nr:GTPase Era [Polyangiaceae bacterium]